MASIFSEAISKFIYGLSLETFSFTSLPHNVSFSGQNTNDTTIIVIILLLIIIIMHTMVLVPGVLILLAEYSASTSKLIKLL